MQFEDTIIDLDKIECIALNSVCWIGGPLSYNITVFLKDESFDFFKTRQHSAILNIYEEILKSLLSTGKKNYAKIGEFIVNLNKLERCRNQSNSLGQHRIKLEFKNGKTFESDYGFDSKNCDEDYKNYKKQLVAYISSSQNHEQ